MRTWCGHGKTRGDWPGEVPGKAARGRMAGCAEHGAGCTRRWGRRQGAGLPVGKEAFEAGKQAVELLEQQGEQGIARPEMRACVFTPLGGQGGAQRGERGGGGVHLSSIYITDNFLQGKNHRCGTSRRVVAEALRIRPRQLHPYATTARRMCPAGIQPRETSPGAMQRRGGTGGFRRVVGLYQILKRRCGLRKKTGRCPDPPGAEPLDLILLK